MDLPRILWVAYHPEAPDPAECCHSHQHTPLQKHCPDSDWTFMVRFAIALETTIIKLSKDKSDEYPVRFCTEICCFTIQPQLIAQSALSAQRPTFNLFHSVLQNVAAHSF